MTRDEYERRKRRLEEQHREGVALLEAAYRQQLRALELVWMTNEEVLPAPPPEAPAPPPPSPPPRRPAWALIEDLERVLPGLPETFDRNDVCRAIGYEPDRGTLFRILQDLVVDGVLVLQQRGSGKHPSVYRKAGPQHNDSGG
jgi:hypothetical protein